MTSPNFQDYPINDLTKIIVNEIFQTYFAYGPGLFERVYEAGLAGRLRSLGMHVTRQEQVYINDPFVENEPAFKADLIVENRVIIELKSVAQLAPVMHAQIKTYVQLTKLEIGLLVNFNCTVLKDNIHRTVYRYDPSRHRLAG